MSSKQILPAPGYVLVQQIKTTGESIGGVALAARENAMHEGSVLAIGHIPSRFRMGLRVGDAITFARFNAVRVSDGDEELLAVGMQYIVCVKREASRSRFWSRVRAALNIGVFTFGFGAGWIANDIKGFFKSWKK